MLRVRGEGVRLESLTRENRGKTETVGETVGKPWDTKPWDTHFFLASAGSSERLHTHFPGRAGRHGAGMAGRWDIHFYGRSRRTEGTEGHPLRRAVARRAERRDTPPTPVVAGTTMGDHLACRGPAGPHFQVASEETVGHPLYPPRADRERWDRSGRSGTPTLRRRVVVGERWDTHCYGPQGGTGSSETVIGGE